MKLEKFTNNSRKNFTYILIFIVLFIGVSIGIIIQKTYASFQETKTFNVIEGTVKYEGTGDVFVAAYVDGVKTDKFPDKTDYYYNVKSSNCTNEAILNFDLLKWKANISEVTLPNTKCNLYFYSKNNVTNLIYEKMVELEKSDNENLIYDNNTDKNIRYIGANPNNYVKFNDELWRIIGTFNDIDDGTGKKEWRTKIIRNESIGAYSWDSSPSSINGGGGINEWSTSDIMNVLNNGAYWNKLNTLCYGGTNNATVTCDFSSIGLTNEAKNMIGTSVWHIGGNGDVIAYNDILTSKFYEIERSTNTGKICSLGAYCNDEVLRTTKWTGRIGLMYPSDYGYATGIDSRENCLNTILYSWNSEQICFNDNWLYTNLTQWTMTPASYSGYSTNVFYVHSNGAVDESYSNASFAYEIRPTLYLTPNVYITSGTGTNLDPYILDFQ